MRRPEKNSVLNTLPSMPERYAFFDSIRAQLETQGSTGFVVRSKNSGPWLCKPLAGPRIGLYADAFRVRSPMYVGFYRDDPLTERTFAALSTVANELERLLGPPLRVQKPGLNGKGCNIVQPLPFDPVERRLPAREWIADRLRRFDLAFSPFTDW
jgi:hypothetical protein